jgi:hypothetical protein
MKDAPDSPAAFYLKMSLTVMVANMMTYGHTTDKEKSKVFITYQALEQISSTKIETVHAGRIRGNSSATDLKEVRFTIKLPFDEQDLT